MQTMFFTPVNTPAEQSYKTGRCDTVQWKAEKSKVMTSADFHYTLVKDKITYNKNIIYYKVKKKNAVIYPQFLCVNHKKTAELLDYF